MKSFRKFYNHFLCFLFNHNVISHTNSFNKVITHSCTRCLKTLDIEHDSYNVKCIINGRVRSAPLIKENLHTVLIGYGERIIKRHKIKHQVILSI